MATTALPVPRGPPERDRALQTAGMEVALSEPALSDAAEFIDAVRASGPLHIPWLALPDTNELFAAYLDRAARDDQPSYLIRPPRQLRGRSPRAHGRAGPGSVTPSSGSSAERRSAAGRPSG
jgi:hypothetical protein